MSIIYFLLSCRFGIDSYIFSSKLIQRNVKIAFLAQRECFYRAFLIFNLKLLPPSPLPLERWGNCILISLSAIISRVYHDSLVNIHRSLVELWVNLIQTSVDDIKIACFHYLNFIDYFRPLPLYDKITFSLFCNLTVMLHLCFLTLGLRLNLYCPINF